MQVQCPNCKVLVKVSPETFLTQNHVMCFQCMFTIELRNSDGTLKDVQFSFEQEKRKKEESD
jgi:hypothetical protein